MNLNNFILFDPLVNVRNDLPLSPGNYIVTIRDINTLPTKGCKIVTPIFRGHNLIYTGITGGTLRNRIWNQHLGDNAGRSTLRLSLGCLKDYKLIPRDKNNPDNGIVRFCHEDEKELQKWMMNNLLFYYFQNNNAKKIEEELIETFNPPLNLMKNYNPVNQEYRRVISNLRRQKPWRTTNLGLLGRDGENAVTNELRKRGFIVINLNDVSNNFPKADLFCYSPKTGKHTLVQVKTGTTHNIITGLKSSFNGIIKNLDKEIVCPWVFVYTDKNAKDNSQPEFYILSRDEVYDLIYESNNWYANQWNRTLKVGYQVGVELDWLRAERSSENGSLHGVFDSTLKETALDKWEKLPL